MDWKLEVVIVPVSDIDRARHFYETQVGFVVDHDTRIGEGVTTLGMPIGLAVIVFTIVITAIYVRRANNEFDQLSDDITKAVLK